jgi:uncharacterized protein
MITDLSQEEARKLLGQQRIARLGCVLGSGEPYVVPVNYIFKDDSVYIHSKYGLKIEALRENPKACVEVDDIRDLFNWRSVVAFGEFEEVTEETERDEIFQDLFALFQELTPVEAPKLRRFETEETVLFRIRLRLMTGREES